MPWIIGGLLGGAILGSSVIGGGAALAGGAAQANAANTSANLQNQQYLQTRQDYAPWRASGVGALGQINALMGLGGSTQVGGSTGGATQNAFAQQTPKVGQLYANQSSRGKTPIQDIEAALALGRPISDASWAQAGFGPGGAGYYQTGQAPGSTPTADVPQVDAATAQQNAFAQFRTDPGYQFAFDEGSKALQNSAAARGILNSGATAKALTRYGQGVADQQYGNYFARLQSLAGLGQSATGATAQAGQAAAGNAGNALMAGGNARASAYGGAATAANQGIQNYLMAGALGGGGYANYSGGNWNPGPQGFPI